MNASVECGDLIALDKIDGQEVWRQSGIDESWSTPSIYEAADGSTELALTIKGKILSLIRAIVHRAGTPPGFATISAQSLWRQMEFYLPVVGGKTK